MNLNLIHWPTKRLVIKQPFRSLGSRRFLKVLSQTQSSEHVVNKKVVIFQTCICDFQIGLFWDPRLPAISQSENPNFLGLRSIWDLHENPSVSNLRMLGWLTLIFSLLNFSINCIFSSISKTFSWVFGPIPIQIWPSTKSDTIPIWFGLRPRSYPILAKIPRLPKSDHGSHICMYVQQLPKQIQYLS